MQNYFLRSFFILMPFFKMIKTTNNKWKCENLVSKVKKVLAAIFFEFFKIIVS